MRIVPTGEANRPLRTSADDWPRSSSAMAGLGGVPVPYAGVMSAEQEIERVVDMAVNGRRADGDAFDKIDETALHALAGLKLIAVRLDALSERIDDLDDESSSELADLRQEVKKLRKLVKKRHHNGS
jgi:hypothetical protein